MMKKIRHITAVIMAMVLVINAPVAVAADNIATESGDAVISVELPTVSEGGTSVFDFLIDPQGLIYETEAARYGGGGVEEGATVLFHNYEGSYDFSSTSDKLTVSNYSPYVEIVTVRACIKNLGDIDTVENKSLVKGEECTMYMAVTDDEGRVIPLSENGEVTLTAVVTDEGGQYSFGLTGYCNPDGSWEDIEVSPVVEITWDIEVIIPQINEVETEDDNEVSGEDIEEDKYNSEPEETGSADSTSDAKGTEEGVISEEQSLN